MGKPMAKVFDCFKDGKFIYRGTAQEIANRLDIPQSATINVYAISGKAYHYAYTFVFTGEYRNKLDFKPMSAKKKEPTQHELDLEWIRIALNKSPYYMTSYHNDGAEFVEELKSEGITFRAEKHPIDKGDYFLIRT